VKLQEQRKAVQLSDHCCHVMLQSRDVPGTSFYRVPSTGY